MSAIAHAGPFKVFTDMDGSSVPLYLIPFDKEGRCIGPNTLRELQTEAASGQFTDIHIYAHGWNNLFEEAIEHYTEFFTEYFELRKKVSLPNANYRPLIAGVIWPSTAMLAEDEEPPRFSGGAPASARAIGAHDELFAVTELAGTLPAAEVQRFFELSTRGQPLTRLETLEFARILLPVFRREADDQEGIVQTVTPEKLVKVWEQTAYDTASTKRPGTGKPAALPDWN